MIHEQKPFIERYIQPLITLSQHSDINAIVSYVNVSNPDPFSLMIVVERIHIPSFANSFTQTEEDYTDNIVPSLSPCTYNLPDYRL